MDAICMTMILLNLNCRAVYATRRRTISLIAIALIEQSEHSGPRLKMRYAPKMFLFFLFSGFCAGGQVPPASNGSCSVSPSGVMGCQWMGGVEGSKLFVTHYRLAPGAPLSTPVEGQDAVIVGMSDGELSNEKKSPPSHVGVSNSSVILMPKEEPYLSRNVGKETLELLVIEIRN